MSYGHIVYDLVNGIRPHLSLLVLVCSMPKQTYPMKLTVSWIYSSLAAVKTTGAIAWVTAAADLSLTAPRTL